MYKYRISKYNPLFRATNGRYLKEDWISISDIGKTFDGTQLTIESYKAIEDGYVNALHLIIGYMNIPFLSIKNFSKNSSIDVLQDLIKKYPGLYTEKILDTYHDSKELDNLEKDVLDSYSRLLLRENIWSEVFYQEKVKVFIKYDYLMGIHSNQSLEKIIPDIEKLGLFVEKF